jgi:PhnB protein
MAENSSIGSLQPETRSGKELPMAAAAKGIPKGYRNITPYFVVRGVPRLLDFLRDAFDAKEIIRAVEADGRVMHAAVQIGDSMLEMGDIGGSESAEFPAQLHYYVRDADAVYQKALRAGAKSLYPPKDMPCGDLEAGVQDSCGNDWFVATHKSGSSYRPDLLQDVNAGVSLKDASRFLAFVEKAFGAMVLQKHEFQPGMIGHAKIRIGDTVVELSEAHGQWGPRATALHYYTGNCDTVFSQALAAGAKILWPVEDKLYGDRAGGLLDDWGNHWYISTHKEDLTLEEIRQRAEAAR